jgi:hypothetical protein
MRRLIAVLMVVLLPAQWSLAWTAHGRDHRDWSHGEAPGKPLPHVARNILAAMNAHGGAQADPLHHPAGGQHQCHLADLLGLPSRLIIVHQEAPEHSFSAKIPHAGHALAPPLPDRPPMPVLAA